MTKSRRHPKEGDLIRVFGDSVAEAHICTVRDLLAVQFTASYETARPDGGWTEHTVFCFYGDHGVEWEFAEAGE